MTKDLPVRFLAVVLALLTITSVFFAWINFQKEREFVSPYDGVWWVEHDGHLQARRLDADGPGARAGIKLGDVLISVNDHPIQTIAALSRQLYRAGTYARATYGLERGRVPVNVPVILVPYDRSVNTGLRLIALIYLGIGLYVLLRRWTAPRATHFYLFCLTSFIFYSFHYTGKLNEFDWIVYWSNVVAELLQPALFLHFVLMFPERKRLIDENRWLAPLIYLPALFLLGAHVGALRLLEPSEVLRHRLDQVEMSYLALYFLTAAGVLWHSYKSARTPILRQQMKWVTRGTTLAIVPFTLFYVIPYLNGSAPSSLMRISVLCLVFIPLTFGYAIFRYRLMDVDLIFKRGMVYTLAAAAIVGGYFAV
ncbi:MAG TPA: histidine kinase N-terminal 7TM domain-containing protein, partial [Terriglobales bacterium]|nr:histidine kinase N-terminal 7TM domain-containing protein [Terriglobales bacterium]